MTAYNPLLTFGLSGRTALVTGGRREIGRAISLALAAQGAEIAVHHSGTAEESQDAQDVVGEIALMGRQAAHFAADFTKAESASQLAMEVQAALGRIDILVLNASIEIPEDYCDISDEHFDLQVSVNLRATLALLQALVPPMAERGWGRVVAIGSIQQVLPNSQMLVYAGTKAAQMNWVLNLARQVGRHGVTVNNLAPGAIMTARSRTPLERDREIILERTPVGRFGVPEDLVGAALLLCFDAGSFINGTNLFVDGGRHSA